MLIQCWNFQFGTLVRQVFNAILNSWKFWPLFSHPFPYFPIAYLYKQSSIVPLVCSNLREQSQLLIRNHEMLYIRICNVPTWILATEVDCWSQMEVTGRLSFLSYSPCLKNSSQTFMLHFWDMSHGLVGFEMSAHFSAIWRMKLLSSGLVMSKLSSSKFFWGKIHYSININSAESHKIFVYTVVPTTFDRVWDLAGDFCSV